MTRTSPTGSPAPVFPPGRYGRRRDPSRQAQRRWAIWILAAVVAALGVGIAVKMYRQYAQAPYQASAVAVTDITDSAVTVTFEVVKPEGSPASCTVVAHSHGGVEVGRAEVDVPADAPHVSRVTYTLKTTQRPVTGEVSGCGPGR